MAISTIIPSEYPGVTTESATGLENLRCFPGIPNSKTSGVDTVSVFHFFDFLIFLEWNS